MVTRTAGNDDTQRWELTYLGGDTYTIQQKSSGRFIDAYAQEGNDFAMVTRTFQDNDTQRWEIKRTFPFPGGAEDLSFGAVWRVTNDHYDMHAVRFDEAQGKWTRNRPGADSNNPNHEDSLIYGVPVYSIASGEVFHYWRNHPENPIDDIPLPGRDGCSDSDGDGNVCDDYDECDCSIIRCGKHVTIFTDDGKKILYAHLQPGTVPPDICPYDAETVADANNKVEKILSEGKGGTTEAVPEAWIPEGERPRVQAGDFLGLVGDSGASSGPHLHNHMVDAETGLKIDIAYKNAWVQSYPDESTNVLASNWETLQEPLKVKNSQQIMQPMPQGVYTLQQKSNGRFVDAYGDAGNDFAVVTRTA